jgi:uracil-DNA glycosylase
MPKASLAATEPPRDCDRCPRLAALRRELRHDYPDWWNAPVPTIGSPAAWLAIIGLAPGKHGANRTGRPFTGDDSGLLLFATLAKHGLAADGDLRPGGAAILNAVKCLPPGNRPTPAEVAQCRLYLASQLAALRQVRVIMPLGRIAHDAVLRAIELSPARMPFAHGAEHGLDDGRILISSYHPSRYNQNTGRLTPAMLDAVFARALQLKAAGENAPPLARTAPA